MSFNNLDGFLTGTFIKVYGIYLQEVTYDNGMHCKWSNFLTDALLYDSEEEAWDFILTTWGNFFGKTRFGVIAIHDKTITHSIDTKVRNIHG